MDRCLLALGCKLHTVDQPFLVTHRNLTLSHTSHLLLSSLAAFFTCCPPPTHYRYLAECPDAHGHEVLRLLPTLLQAAPSSLKDGPAPDGVAFMAPLLLQRGDEEVVRERVAGNEGCVAAIKGGLQRRVGVVGAEGEVEMLRAVMEVLRLQ